MINDEKHNNDSNISNAEGKRIALVVGVNGSAKYTLQAPLKYAENDAYEIAQVLESAACNFTILSALRGKEATSRDVMEAIMKMAEENTYQDFLCFYFSGHAEPMRVNGDREDIYFVTHDFSESYLVQNPNFHISMNWLWDILYQKTNAGKVLIILDCCYAGNILSTEPNPFQIDLYKLFNDYFEERNIEEQNRSRFILSATAHNAAAREQDGHGNMTRFLLKALRGEDKRHMMRKVIFMFLP